MSPPSADSSRQNAEEGGFAGAVDADEPYFIIFLNFKRKIVKQQLGAEAFARC